MNVFLNNVNNNRMLFNNYYYYNNSAIIFSSVSHKLATLRIHIRPGNLASFKTQHYVACGNKGHYPTDTNMENGC